ncbi:MAG TPA: DNA polymerase III subunit alpha [Candidatus Aminicenantes bacterium]|nr:DNA polymerase III subunit alpha [Candidatus Aminicenantes bacterium]HOY98481.1 DNA polymerase III subunit alpha [Candidatus Aminicenantes bacterium]HPH44629.1 DNA polymerase III subunit alpha [Candidatus Aminicenantes bacterium]HPN16097.1 DNA polymerase III subunit alpha [Candidatus Aminicenantes bacterium]
MAPGFIHLHNHSEYSILDGAVRLDALVQAAVDHKMPAVALTDHGNLFGAVKFQRIAKDKGVKPIFGCEAYIAPRSRRDRELRDGEPAHYHLLLLVENETGYKNLCVLLSKAYLEGFYYRPRIDKELLAAHSKGLIGFSACLRGEIAYLFGQGREEAALRAAESYAEIFGPGNFYIELMDHGLEPQREVNPKLVGLARRLGLPLVATNDIHFLGKADAASHDVLLCIQTNKKISDTDRIKFGSAEFYFKPPAEMERLFGEIPEALDNTFHVAARCDFEFPKGTYFLPRFEPPEGKSLRDYFEEVVWAGFSERADKLRDLRAKGKLVHDLDAYKDRLEREIQLVKQMQFEGYFLIVWDLLRTARSRNIPVGPGRGSAAGSLLAYCLQITDIDPLEYDLLFERFLNPERISLPDIDMDFCARRRAEMISYVTEKYGQENVSQIITFGTMAARAAIRDVGRVLEVPLSEVDKVAKMVPLGPDVKIASAVQDAGPLQEYVERNPRIKALLDIAEKVEGQVRHPSIHAAGLVITPRPLTEFLPLYQSVKGEVTTQFAMSEIEAIGLLKMDLLGLRNLTVIRDAQNLIAKDFGTAPDVDALPLDDGPTFDLFKAGNTDGVFQFESQGMKALLRSYKPEEFRDLIALNALYRPGPLKSGMANDFIERKFHPEKIVYDIPELKPILEETRGLIIYQEQVMRIAVELAGFSLSKADLLRKAMGKKKAEIMTAQKQNFLDGAKRKGAISASKAAKIFDQIAKFAEYGFNKSHSAAYAALAYQTAYLKAHHPTHFMAALMTSEAERGATSQIVKYVAECQVLGLEVRPPDINKSDFDFIVEDRAVRFGLAAVKNVGETAARALIAVRRERGPFQTIFDVVGHADGRIINRKVLESLIKAGAFDSFGLPRARSFRLIDNLIDYNREMQKIRESTQSLLFGRDALAPPEIPAEIAAISEWDEMLKWSYEKEALGFYISGHPLSHYRRILPRLTSHSTASFEEEADIPEEIRVAGVIADFQMKKTKKDERMAVFQLEDLTGRVEVVVYAEPYKRYYHVLQEGSLVWIKGHYQLDGETHKIYLSHILPLEEAAQKLAKKFVVRLPARPLNEAVLQDMREVLEKSPGECPAVFELETPSGHRVVLQSPELKGVTPTDDLLTSLETLLGPDSIRVDY